MGVDCKVTLVPGVRVRDVANVIGIAAGLPWERKALGQSHPDAWYVVVPQVEVKPSSMPELAFIFLKGMTNDGETDHHLSYHFEWDGGETPGCTGLMPRSTPFWIAVMLKTVEFFGGSIDFNDCDDVEIDRVFPMNHRSPTNSEWNAYQSAIAAVEPVTQEDLIQAKEWESYS